MKIAGRAGNVKPRGAQRNAEKAGGATEEIQSAEEGGSALAMVGESAETIWKSFSLLKF